MVSMKIKTNRIESIDFLRGVVMIIMALDHVRDYFNYGAFIGDPTDLETTTPFLFFTRIITHYCAPIFVLLTGTAAYIYGSKKSKLTLSKFLLTRGLWLIFLELILNNFIWWFDLTYNFIVFQVIWAIGISMVLLSGMVYLHKKYILFIGILITLFHNLLDQLIVEGINFTSILWYILHQGGSIPFNDGTLNFFYPVIPWTGIMCLGYCLGSLYTKDVDKEYRIALLYKIGIVAVVAFALLRFLSFYGDAHLWEIQKTIGMTIMDFFKVSKYPPSLHYTLMTVGPALILLAFIEKYKNKFTDFFVVFGRVPLLYYFLHVLVIHIFAIIVLILTGDDWSLMIINSASFKNQLLLDYGYNLFIVYLIWLILIALLYPICKKYMIYKASNRDKWWLSYL